MATSGPGVARRLPPDDYELYRRNIASLEERIRASPWGRDVDASILTAIRSVPRHLFVPSAHRALAYADVALPTAYGMTTTAPSVVGYMVYLAAVRSGSRVLEIGTGTGYQAAVLAAMGARVCTIERSPGLAQAAAGLLDRLGYRSGAGRVRIFHGNGSAGYMGGAPYHAILVAAAVQSMDRLAPLGDQLAGGGRLVAPVGRLHDQHLAVMERLRNGIRIGVVEGLTVDFVRLVERSR